jgi:DNA invertase Pin-like site-specific DNA recombinase
MLAFADELHGRGAGLRVLNLGGGDVDTATPMGSMLFTIMAALAQMEHEIKSERVRFHQQTQRSWKGPWRPTRRLTDSQIRSAVRLLKAASPPRRLPAISKCPEQCFTGAPEH